MRLSGLKNICHDICPKHKPNKGLITKCFPLNRSILWAFLDLLHEQMKAAKVATLRQASWASHCAQERKGNQDTEKPKWALIDRTKESKHNSQKWKACRSSSFAGVAAFNNHWGLAIGGCGNLDHSCQPQPPKAANSRDLAIRGLWELSIYLIRGWGRNVDRWGCWLSASVAAGLLLGYFCWLWWVPGLLWWLGCCVALLGCTRGQGHNRQKLKNPEI